MDLKSLLGNHEFSIIDDNHKTHFPLVLGGQECCDLPALSRSKKPRRRQRLSTRRKSMSYLSLLSEEGKSMIQQSQTTSKIILPILQWHSPSTECPNERHEQRNFLASISSSRFIDTSSPMGVRQPSRITFDFDRVLCSATE